MKGLGVIYGAVVMGSCTYIKNCLKCMTGAICKYNSRPDIGRHNMNVVHGLSGVLGS